LVAVAVVVTIPKMVFPVVPVVAADGATLGVLMARPVQELQIKVTPVAL